MLAALIIVFREVIEAGLIIGIAAAVTRGHVHNRLWIGGGVLSGLLGSCVVAAFVGTIAAAFGGSGHEIFNAAILGVAVVMLACHNIWMARHGRALAAELGAVGQAATSGAGTMTGLALVVGIAVLREGSEVVLFLTGVAVSGGESAWTILAGGLIGLTLGAALSILTYTGLVVIPTRHLFRVTTLLITFLAAGMAAQAVALLEQGGVINFLTGTVWNTSGYLSDGSIVGRILHTLIGYNDRPSGIELLVYLLTLGVILLLTQMSQSRRAARPEIA
jgi:high-affinity iron transporter